MDPQSVRMLLLDNVVLLAHGTITFLPLRDKPVQEPLLTHFAVITPDIGDLTPLHEAVVAHQEGAELCLWTAILEGHTLHLRGVIQGWHLEYGPGISGRLSIETRPL